jgi:hypothetical protein
VITSAAAIMVAVFAGFAQADLLPVKQLGVGLALAVFLDATVVRGVLVPAAMAVMGRGNWWWPRYEFRRQRTVLPQKNATTVPLQRVVTTELPQPIATTAPEGSVGVRDEKPFVGGFDAHAFCTCGADLGVVGILAGPPQRDAVDVAQTVVLERPAHKPATTMHETGPGRIHHAADVTQTVVLERPSWLSVP